MPPSRPLLLVTLVVLSTSGCQCGESTGPGESAGTASATATSGAASTASSAAAGRPVVTPEQKAQWSACAERRKTLEGQDALPGAPEFEKDRIHLARVRGRSLLWRRAPKSESTKLDERVAKNKTALAAVKGLLGKTKQRKRRRELLLREGYLYHHDVDVALALVEMIGLTKLYSEPTLYLQRGAQSYELALLKRTRYLPKRYGYKNGPLKGTTAEILLGDRVGTERDAVEKDPLAIDLRAAMDAGDFDRIRPTHLTDKALVADVRYGPDTWVPAVFDIEGPRLTLGCEALDAELLERKQAFVEDRKLLRTALSRLRQVIDQEVREKIPFDAATGAEMGFLRDAWERAYLQGWSRFTHRERKYDVYSTEGQPIPPQVCIDFIADTWERAAGSWYAPKTGEPPKAKPEHTKGPFDIDDMDLKNRRSVAKFAEFTKRHPELFDTWDPPKDQRVLFKERRAFFEMLAKNADRFLPGDVIVVHGYKEGGRPHYHSLFITQVDPVTGVPTRVAGNAVFPREQTLEGILQISPKRSIRHRIRLRRPWLEHIAAKAAEQAEAPTQDKAPEQDEAPEQDAGRD